MSSLNNLWMISRSKMAVNLYDHQKKAVEMLKPGSVLCGGVGTGKSRTALAYFYQKICGGKLPRKGGSEVVEIKDPVPLVIITTARKRDTNEWEEELIPFLLSSKTDSPVQVLVDSWNNIKKYQDFTNCFFIFDEQRLVGNGAWVKAFLKIAKSNRWILLTATPGDTWLDYCPVFIANGFYKNRTEFIREHVVYNRFVKFPQVQRYVNTNRLEKYRKQIVIPMTYEKPATQHHEFVKVGYPQDEYQRTIENKWDFRNDAPIKNITDMCRILRTLVNSDLRRCTAVSHILSNHPKAIIFYNFDYELEMLRRMCSLIEIPYSEWNGHKHEDIPTENAWAYLVQYTAGSEGWNCIETDTVIFFSQNYSYRTMTQATGRIDRMNTKFTDLYYYHIFSDAPIEQAIRKCLNRKKDFNEATFGRSLEFAS